MTHPSAWESAPAGLLLLAPDGTVRSANATLLRWTGRAAADVEGRLRLPDLLTVAGRIYWETHLAPLLEVEGRFEQVALDLSTPDGRLPVLVSGAREQVDGAETVSVAITVVHERRRYEQELLGARRAAEQAAARVGALQAVTAALSSAVGGTAVADALLAAALQHLGASSAAVWLPDDTGALVLHAAAGDEAVTQERPVADVEPVEVDGRVVVALRGQSRPRGVLLLAPDPVAEPVPLEVIAAAAAQAGLALDRAALFDESRDVASQLQRALLSGRPPEDERVAVAMVYRPGVEALEVGGDWHDVFRVPETQRLSVSVGDVVGRGIRAAGAMGQLRSAVRALTADDVGPAQVLSRLDAFVGQVEAAAMATLVLAELDLDTGLLDYACAGHLPPLLLPASGEPRLLWDGRSTPLGAFLTGGRGQARVQLEPGDRVLLYTDGLVERRDRGLDEGLEALQRAAHLARTGEVAPGVEALTAELLRDERTRDDVCVLLLGWLGATLERRVGADLSGLSELRRELRGWLGEQGVPEGPRDDIVLAASEAVANAAEHGCASDPAQQVLLRAVVAPSEESTHVTVSVHDGGRWRAPVADLERGRGLTIIRALVDEVEVDRGAGTTVVLHRTVEALPA